MTQYAVLKLFERTTSVSGPYAFEFNIRSKPVAEVYEVSTGFKKLRLRREVKDWLDEHQIQHELYEHYSFRSYFNLDRLELTPVARNIKFILGFKTSSDFMLFKLRWL